LVVTKDKVAERGRCVFRGRMLSDADLVRAAQGGDVTSLGLLLERHRASLYGQALGILGYGPQAEDAVHDAFVVALRKIDRVREPDAVGGWLRAVLRSVCLMRLRTGRGEILFEETQLHTQGRIPSEMSVEESIDRLAMREWVWTALSELPEALRVTAMLRYFGSSSSYEEIAAILGAPVGTVRSRLNQVKTKLADALLKTAGLAHDEAGRLTESQARYFGAAAEEINSGQGYDLLLNAYSDAPTCVLSGGPTLHGRGAVIESLESDLEAGVRTHPTSVLSSKDITIFEADFENPCDDPFHCPPATTQVHFQRDGLTHRVHLHFAPRPREEGGS
jgi:RNA polymerase sigma factor (sigma-70 family)